MSLQEVTRDLSSGLSPEPVPKYFTEFPYIPLSDLKSCFRLVILNPASDVSSSIHCEVLNASLDCVCEYEALSYVWGEIKAQSPIYLRHASSDDKPLETESFEFFTTLNLEAALRALRLRGQPRTLWIDSICIDQGNLRERNQQVRLMGQIYQKCTRDVLWLGSETDKIRRAMDLVKKLASNTQESVKLSELREDEWGDIEAMIGANPAWNRIWIVQELYFAPKILLFCHGQSLDWGIVVDMLENNKEFQDIWINQAESQVFKDAHRCFNSITIFHTMRHKLSAARGLFDRNLMSVVLTFGNWGATQTVDKIYGVLNLAEDAEGFPVEYEKSLDEVSLEFANHLITRSKSLLILSAALGDPLEIQSVNTEGEPREAGRLPSWVMNISKPIPSVSGLTLCGQTHYNACGMMVQPICGVSDDKRRLVASGWLIDTVSVLETVIHRENEAPRERWVRDVRRWAPADGMTRLYIPTNETFLNAYFRTITTDRKQDRRIRTEDVEGETWYERYQELEERVVPDEQVMLPGWRFGTSRSGIFCMLPPAARENDLIVILFGGKVPYLLRPVEPRGTGYKLVGEAYMHGFMDGQVLVHVAKEIQEGTMEMPKAFTIV